MTLVIKYVSVASQIKPVPSREQFLSPAPVSRAHDNRCCLCPLPLWQVFLWLVCRHPSNAPSWWRWCLGWMVFRSVQSSAMFSRLVSLETMMLVGPYRLPVGRFWSCTSRKCEMAETCENQGVHCLMDPEKKGKRHRKKELDQSQIARCLATGWGH